MTGYYEVFFCIICVCLFFLGRIEPTVLCLSDRVGDVTACVGVFEGGVEVGQDWGLGR